MLVREELIAEEAAEPLSPPELNPICVDTELEPDIKEPLAIYPESTR